MLLAPRVELTRFATYRVDVIGIIALLFAMRIAAAAFIPIAGDEALYWRYSRHLAWGFIDHPPMNATLIRIGTTLFGQNTFGVRICSILLSLPASWAVWRSGAILFRNENVGATAALLFNLTLMVTVGTLAATSDVPVVLFSALILLSLAKLDETDEGVWWLAVGVAFGLGMFSKYTTAFFAPSILLWLCLTPSRRKWLISPWPWAAGIIALAIFSPVLAWNAGHEWASFVYQSHRMVVQTFSLQFPLELIGSQIVLLTPPVFALACIGVGWGIRLRDEPLSARVLLAALVAPLLIYFLWHSLHERVQGNWPEPTYPALAVLASAAFHGLRARGDCVGRAASWAYKSCVPFGLALAALVILNAVFSFAPLGRRDPTAKVLAYGLPDLAARIDALRMDIGAPLVLVSDYTIGGWLAFYLPSSSLVEQINERIRWIDAPQPNLKQLGGPLLYVCKGDCPDVDALKRRFDRVERLATLPRERNGAVINTYGVYRLAEPIRPVLDPVYPAMNLGVRQ